VVNADELAAEGQESRMLPQSEPAKRGQIISEDGTVLATDAVRYEIQVNQTEIVDFKAKDKDGKVIAEGPKGAAAILAPLIGMTEEEAFKELDGDKTWEPLMKEATQAQWDAVRKAGVTGVYGKKFYVRQYPAGTLAGNLIGYPYGEEGDEYGDPKHFTGLEGEKNTVLAGTAGVTQTEVGAGGRPIPGGRVVSDPAEPGCDVTLTINSDLQWRAQQAVDAQREATNAEAVMAVAIDIPTGEILMLADSGAIDPSDPDPANGRILGSRAVENIFEPGSTGKVVAMAMLLETGVATPTSQYSVPSPWQYRGEIYRDSHPHGTENMTLAGVLAQSSNVGTLMASQSVPNQTRYDYLKKFGFGTPTGVELPAESAGILNSPDDPILVGDGRTMNTWLFGQGVAVNALQATQVFATIGNGGMALKPHLVKGTTCEGEGFVPTAQVPGTRVVSEKTATEVSQMLEMSVNEGTGAAAKIDGYRVGGKTGTAEMIEGADQWKVGSFVGLAPAEAPRVAVGVFVIAPSGEGYGSEVAAPVFKDLAAAALDRLGVPPSTTPAPELPLTW
jgi:cell division protein FtsI (penicillin-binding protein 3)